jgi:flavin reductase (DIM6/NTAB) family NADH-FMN oxidoreductase RutF
MPYAELCEQTQDQNAQHQEVSPDEFRGALSQAITAVTVVTTDGANGRAGVTCSAVSAVCDTPPTVLVCINRRSFANQVIKANEVLCVNWLSALQAHVSQVFAGAGGIPMNERFATGEWTTLATGAPASRNAVVSLDCRVVEAMEIGTHSVFLARVLATAGSESAHPLAYCRRDYATTHPIVSAARAQA